MEYTAQVTHQWAFALSWKQREQAEKKEEKRKEAFIKIDSNITWGYFRVPSQPPPITLLQVAEEDILQWRLRFSAAMNVRFQHLFLWHDSSRP